MQSVLLGNVFEVRKITTLTKVETVGYYLTKELADKVAQEIKESTGKFTYVNSVDAISYDNGNTYQRMNLSVSQEKLNIKRE